MAKHALKLDPEYVPELLSGELRCQIRKNDRDYFPGDTLELRETLHTAAAMRDGAPLKYTGRVIHAGVLGVLYLGQFGLDPDFVALSITLIGDGVDMRLKEAA
ncbi:DUF3850 domain-containing protein [Methylomonas sp. SURF-1]|uniref:DUF3850 domain-containing protein n=1 Tax=Methylomonas aurea TaxID=2952224 RepID=A0ABT1UKL3_9GAMM|nr:DUF3850 domain-containing protein [Methylomonas sp. SURF-1]MCQ8182210.1 DUF3850 domain-containing protein [Methylomonas sp. SURF-1]